MDSEIYNILNHKNNSDNLLIELKQTVANNFQKYNELKKSCDIIKEIYLELQEKQKKYKDHIFFLENLQTETNNVFIEISKK